MIELKTATEIDALAETGRIVARTLRAVRAHARPGITLRELDDLARTTITDAGARACRTAAGAICTSVNDAIAHGIPDGTRLADGDLISIDCAASLHGWFGAAAITFSVGQARPEDTALVRAAEQSLADGIAAAQPGARLGDVSRAIGVLGRSAGYGIPAGLGGAGVGRDRREAPPVPNDGHPGKGVPLRPGLVLSIEPVLSAGGTDSTRSDGPVVRTADGSRAAHTGHTIAITAEGPRILTGN
ncbi:methionyl aminopeptidase [Saccharopolyspora kobensis]|uniref:Methionine aminopeptidase n=1 Tax=Saccharopolyspora kobensis TaxID=146035 RepID=A0A1H5WSM1_9PSEU|nr:type I methionyl aminopeptidase [Saccharopolyspora kobensis]SEG02431.1 methionyl aminopeptidase [Saccharopolyspora kobensis]SFD79218.1 methionyl aminopeptidase [Saccharopolyspora kobensis]